MIKKLRLRFIAVIMTLVIVIMLIIMSAIYIYMYRSENKNSDAAINLAFSQQGFGMDDRARRNDEPPQKPPEMAEEAQSAPVQNADKSRRETEENKTDPPVKKQFEPGKPGNSGQVTFQKSPFDFNPFFNNMPGNRDIWSSGWIRLRIEDGEVSNIFRSQRRPTDTDEDEERINAEMSEIAGVVIGKGSENGRISAFGVHYKYLYRNDTIILLDITQNDQTLARLMIILVIIFFATLAVFLCIAFFLSKWISVPIEEAWRSQSEFFSNASHELKTPLAVISANLDVIRSQPGDPENEKFFGIIHDEADKMTGLISQMLYLSREEYSQNTVMTDIDYSREVNSVCLSVEALAFEKGRTLESAVTDDIIINGDKASINRMIHILTDNAISHSPAGSQVDIRLERIKGKAVLSVENEGTISEDDLAHIFDRFYRTDSSRSRETGGFGLGLAIAKAIAERHNGTITAQSRSNKTTFTVTLPIKH